LFISLLSIGAGIGIYYLLNRHSPLTQDPIMDFVPLNSPMFFECRSLPELTRLISKDNPVLKEIFDSNGFRKTKNQILYLDSLVKDNNELNNLLNENPILIALNQQKDRTEMSFVTQIPRDIEPARIISLIKELFDEQASVTKKKLEKFWVYKVKDLNVGGKYSFDFSIVNNYLVFSFSTLLVEQIVRQVQSQQSINRTKSFLRIYNTAGKNVAGNLYINYKYLPKTLSMYLLNEKVQSRFWSSFANWSVLDLKLNDEGLLLNGYTYSNDSMSNFLNLFKNQNTKEFECVNYLPENTIMFVTFAHEDPTQFAIQSENFSKKNRIVIENKDNIEKLASQLHLDFDKILRSLQDGETGICYAGISKNSSIPNCYGFIKINSHSNAKELLKNMVVMARNNNIANTSISNLTIKGDEINEIPVYQLPSAEILKWMYGNVFSDVSSKYCIVLDDFIIFSSNIDALSDLATNHFSHKSLVNTIQYKTLKKQIADESHIFCYMIPEKMNHLYAQFLNKKTITFWDRNHSVLSFYPTMSIQITADDDFYFTNLYLSYNQVKESEKKTVWESKLDTVFTMKPFLFSNHLSGDYDVFVQDMTNKLYLISPSGRILWKSQLDEPILGSPFAVDLFGNNKIQICFATSSKIYVLDRNGHSVEGFPYVLPDKSSNNLNVIDPDKNENYLITIACKDRTLLVINKKGELNKDWKLTKTENTVVNDICFFRSQNQEFFVVADLQKLYVIDRRGFHLFKPAQINVAYHTQFYNELYTKGNKTQMRIVFTNKEGAISYVYKDGGVEMKKIKAFSADHFFEYTDMDADGNRDFVFLDRNKLEIFNQKLETIGARSFSSNIESKPIIFNFQNSKKRIGITDKIDEKIYLIDGNGQVTNGFPLEGNTPFSIGKMIKNSSEMNIIVGNEKSFLYNYKFK